MTHFLLFVVVLEGHFSTLAIFCLYLHSNSTETYADAKIGMFHVHYSSNFLTKWQYYKPLPAATVIVTFDQFASQFPEGLSFLLVSISAINSHIMMHYVIYLSSITCMIKAM